MTVAQLGLAVDSSDVVQATPALEKMTAAARAAEMAAEGLSGAGKRSGAALAAVSAASQNTRNTMFQLVDIAQTIPLAFQSPIYAVQNFGFQVLQIGQAYYGQGGFKAALTDIGGLLGGFVSKAWPAVAVGAAIYGAWQLLSPMFRNAEQSIDAATRALADQAAPVDSLKARISDLHGLVSTYADAIRDTASAQSAATRSILANTKSEYEAKQQLLALEVKRQQAAVELQKAQLTDLQNQARQSASSAANMLGDDVRGDYKFTRSPITDARLDAIQHAFDQGGVGDKITEMTANIQLSEAAIASLRDALGTPFEDAVVAQVAEDAAKASKGLKAANDNFDVFGKMLADVAPLLHDASDPLTELQANLDKLGALLAAGEISWQQYGEAVNKANLNAASGVLGAVGKITGALSQAFEGNKAIAVANAVINTAEGVTKALAQGGIFGFASAAAIGVAGAAQIASILSAQPGSASVASVNGGAAASAASAAAPPQQASSLNITIRGSGVLSVDDFAKQLAAGLADGQHPDLARQITVTRAA